MLNKKLFIKDKWLNECIKESFEESFSELGLIGVAEELQYIIHDIFKMNSWSEYNGPNYRYFNYNNDIYKIDIEDDGVCEATSSHRILYWKITITKEC